MTFETSKTIISYAVFALLLGVIIGLLLAGPYFQSKPTQVTSKTTMTGYDRVMHSQTFRCGYALWPPLMQKDPNTGVLSGIIYDYVEAMGQALNLKIEWTGEVGWGDFPAALNTGRIDGFCAGVWPNGSRAREVDFTRPILYQPLYAYTRVDEMRFDDNLESANDPNVTLAAVDGEMSSLIAMADFPKAKVDQLPQMSGSGEGFVNIANHKADLIFTDPATFMEYNAKNPGQLRRVVTKAPTRVFGNTIALAHDQYELKRMLDIATEELLLSGQIDKIKARYTVDPDMMLAVDTGYVLPVSSGALPQALPATTVPPVAAPSETSPATTSPVTTAPVTTTPGETPPATSAPSSPPQ